MANYVEACKIKEALLDPTVPTRSISGYWVDSNGKPMLAYFGDSNLQENAHSVPVMSYLFVKYYCVYAEFE
jgi:hypothetical protein